MMGYRLIVVFASSVGFAETPVCVGCRLFATHASTAAWNSIAAFGLWMKCFRFAVVLNEGPSSRTAESDWFERFENRRLLSFHYCRLQLWDSIQNVALREGLGTKADTEEGVGLGYLFATGMMVESADGFGFVGQRMERGQKTYLVLEPCH